MSNENALFRVARRHHYVFLYLHVYGGWYGYGPPAKLDPSAKDESSFLYAKPPSYTPTPINGGPYNVLTTAILIF
jgi:hypothetical protein